MTGSVRERLGCVEDFLRGLTGNTTIADLCCARLARVIPTFFKCARLLLTVLLIVLLCGSFLPTGWEVCFLPPWKFSSYPLRRCTVMLWISPCRSERSCRTWASEARAYFPAVRITRSFLFLIDTVTSPLSFRVAI